jgi:Mg/Co/Ni transporter MgtE
LDTPTLLEENKIINYAVEILKKDGEKDVGKNLSNLFTFEIVKFIKSIKFGEKNLTFSELSVKDRISVVENLPLTINQDIAKFIDSIKELDRYQTKVEIDGEEKSFDIDVTFFDN